ncbi:type II secretion system protein GspJ [Psychromarinibacter sp. S121]|uniref:type II secretion system protein GspJ n=1 Tax=Psychromarinibacter sp. S121 TaxID=3415127 RepID=UPI003C7CE1CF
MTGRDRGLTLLELVVVMAIFAVIALIGAQVIAQAVRSDARLTETSEASAEVAYGLALLSNDLGAAVALPFYPPGNLALPAFDAPARQARFSLSLGGQPGFDGAGPGQARVTWSLNPVTGVVTRQHWPALIPGDTRLAGPEVTVFESITALTVEGYDAADGWTVGYPKPDEDTDALPDAIRVTLEHATLGPLATVVTLR